MTPTDFHQRKQPGPQRGGTTGVSLLGEGSSSSNLYYSPPTRSETYHPPVYQGEPVPRKWYNSWPNWCFCSALEFLNYFGVIYTFGVISGLLVANAGLTCPALYGEQGCEQPILFGYFICAQITLNFLCFHWYKRYNRLKFLIPGQLRDDGPNAAHTKYCYTCKETVPNRSHHCPLCNYCVLRKDHHCFLTGACVGFGNQRYFIGFLFWATIGAGYGTLYSFRYLNTFFQPFLPWGWIDYIGPIAIKKWIFFQHCTLLDLAIVLIFSAGIASTWGALAFFVSQWVLLFRGQSMMDAMRPNAPREPGTFRDRVTTVFGPYFLLNFIIPMPWLRNKLEPQLASVLYGCYLKDV